MTCLLSIRSLNSSTVNSKAMPTHCARCANTRPTSSKRRWQQQNNARQLNTPLPLRVQGVIAAANKKFCKTYCNSRKIMVGYKPLPMRQMAVRSSVADTLQLNIISRRENVATNNTRRESMEFSRRIIYSHNSHVTSV